MAASRHPGFQAGDYVAGFLSWSEHHVARGGQGLFKVQVDAARPLSYYLGLLGMPGGSGWAGRGGVGWGGWLWSSGRGARAEQGCGQGRLAVVAGSRLG